jgi:6-pyruvoyltetrahydropterin/6-carboxytetrahydropterin synthase
MSNAGCPTELHSADRDPAPGIKHRTTSMRVELRKTFQFEAAHLLPRLPESHKCRRLHGHSFQVEIGVAGECDPKLGWLMDYADISAAFKPIWEQLDHRYLNEVAGLENPTSENIAGWIWERLQPELPLLTEVAIAETCQSRCVYRGSAGSAPRRRRPAG